MNNPSQNDPKPHYTKQFKKDYQLARRRQKDMAKLDEVLDKIATGEDLDASYQKHRLQGQWAPAWECHLEPDWILIWNDEDPMQPVFQRTGKHSDIFKR